MIPYNEKIWKYPADKMSLHWVDGRIPRPPVDDVIKSAIGIPTEGYTHQAVFSYPLKGGIEALVRAIAKPIEALIHYSFPVSSIRRVQGHWEISDGKKTIAADRIISTIPLQHLLTALENVPETVRIACDNLKYNSLICVNIGIQGSVPDISWMYVPDLSLGLSNRISFPSHFSRQAAPAGCSSVLAEITHQPGDEVSHFSDNQLVEEVTLTLVAMNVLKKDQIICTSVVRQPFAYVVYDLDYQKNIKIIRDYCESIGIPLVGRFARFEYLNMDGCIRNVMDFVDKTS